MESKVGLWIDHRQAVIVTVTGMGEEIKRIISGMEKHVRFSGDPHSGGSEGAEDHQDRQFAGHLDQYYDEVVAVICDAESILILGPGEAKGELEKRLRGKGLGGRIVGVETVDKMTDPQIAAYVREHLS